MRKYQVLQIQHRQKQRIARLLLPYFQTSRQSIQLRFSGYPSCLNNRLRRTARHLVRSWLYRQQVPKAAGTRGVKAESPVKATETPVKTKPVGVPGTSPWRAFGGSGTAAG